MTSSLVTRLPAAGKVGIALGVALLAAACASSSSTSSASAAAAGAGNTSSASSAPSSGGTTTGGTVITTASGADGTFLTNGSGRTVYLWEADSSGKSTCYGSCAKYWPPVLVTGKLTASGGASAMDLSTITRTGGAKQAAYNGHALYYFVEDTAPGQIKGQGSDSLGALWWLVAPAGSAITTKGTSTSPSPATSTSTHSAY